MKLLARRSERSSLGFLFAFALILFSATSRSQTNGALERSFPQSKDAVERVLKTMQQSIAGRLPVLDGFVVLADHPFDRYKRAYYQSTTQVGPSPSGGSVVRVTTKITAWYADPVSSHSGYRLLTSNGRLEADLLDLLSDELAAQTVSAVDPAEPTRSLSKHPSDPVISAPMPKLPEPGATFPSSISQNLATQAQSPSRSGQRKLTEPNEDLQTETQSLEEILKNQAHPKNLVAVKKSGTPVVATSSLTAKTMFLASAHDEFEMLDFNPDWVHVRLSGLSRGWIWRNSLEMPDGIPDVDTHAGSTPVLAAEELFHVTREETASFPGNWEPLRGKNVKIISVQKTDETAKDAGLAVRLEFAKPLLDKNYTELVRGVVGIVLIFDSADGGMIAATLSTLQQWKAGALSDAALWHQCFFDPPEMLGSSGSAARQ
jgi:hypothetical protein